MLLDKVQLAVADVCATEQGRYRIDALCVEPDGTVAATDGKRLITVGPCGVADEEWLAPKAPPVNPEKRTLIPASLCKAAQKRIGRKAAQKPSLDCAALTQAGESGVELTTTTIAKTLRESELPVEGSFPPWKEMIPEDVESDITVRMDPRMLADTLRTMATMLDAANVDSTAVTFTVRDAEKPIVIRAKLGGDRVATAVVAPVRVKS